MLFVYLRSLVDCIYALTCIFHENKGKSFIYLDSCIINKGENKYTCKGEKFCAFGEIFHVLEDFVENWMHL